ncbi:MAG: hypothetical protein AB8B74_12505 [Crocinitomicaceae bacterium]
MKKNQVLLILSLTLLVLFGCRKKVLRDVVTVDSLGVIHCSNNIFDGDELGLDCGGSCDPCQQLKAPCELTNNEINVFTGFVVQSKSFTANKTLEIDSLTGEYTFKAYTDGTDYLEFYFETKPDITRTYKDGDLIANDGIATVIYKSNSSTDMYMHGELFLNSENGIYSFSSCDADFYNPWNGGSISANQSFKVTFD